MNTDIRDDILEHQTNTPLGGLIGVAVNHPWFGKGKISSICSNCQRVNIEFDDTATTVQEDLYDLLGEDSSWKISIKQLERRFRQLRY